MLLKRIFDIVVSLFGLFILMLLYPFIAILIKICMPGPVLFTQLRAGRFGKPFTIYKFRTMVIHHCGKPISIKGESRITRLGSFLRKHKLDELPELWNVLKGDMSIVGPRPDMLVYAEKLVGNEKCILKLRPGITGPASLKYYNEEELLSKEPNPQKYNDEILWPDKVRINMAYFHNRSFMGDIIIILHTLLMKSKSYLHI